MQNGVARRAARSDSSIKKLDDNTNYFELELAPNADPQVLLRRLIGAGREHRAVRAHAALTPSNLPSTRRCHRHRDGDVRPWIKRCSSSPSASISSACGRSGSSVMTLLVPVLMAGAILFPTYLAMHGSASNAVRHIAIIDATGAGLGDRIAKALMADSSLASAHGDSIAPRVGTWPPRRTSPPRSRRRPIEVKQPNHIAGYLVLDRQHARRQVGAIRGAQCVEHHRHGKAARTSFGRRS